MTERPDRFSTTTTRACLGIGSSDQAANASVPPRTGSITSPGPPTGIARLTNPTWPISVELPSASLTERIVALSSVDGSPRP